MNRYIFLFLIAAFSLLLHAKCVAQKNIVYGAGITYTVGIPTFVPPGNSSRVAIDTVTSKWYEFATPGGWRFAGDRIQRVSGCSAPSYTPTKAQSWIVINNCTEAQNGQGPELYAYSGTAWILLNEKSTAPTYTAGTGISISGDTITNTGDLSNTNEIQTLSISGDTISLSDGGGSVVVPAGSGNTIDSSGIINIKKYGAVGDGATDNQSLIQSLINTHKNIYIPNGNFKVSGTIRVPQGGSIVGCGKGSIVSISAADTLIVLAGNNLISGISIDGTDNSAQIGIYFKGVNNINNSISNCIITDFNNGIRVDSVGFLSGHYSSIIRDNFISSCATGINITQRGEYVSLFNNIVNYCTIAAKIRGGNTKILGGNFSDNGIGLSFDIGPNDSHTSVTGLQCNHNSAKDIEIDSLTQSLIITNCDFFSSSAITLSNSKNVQFTSCNFSANSHNVTNSTEIIYLNNIFYTSGNSPVFDASSKGMLYGNRIKGASNASFDIKTPNASGVFVQNIEVPSTSNRAISITREGVSAASGFMQLWLASSTPGQFAPFWWGRSNSTTTPHWNFIGGQDATSDVGSVPSFVFNTNISSYTSVNRPMYSFDEGSTQVKVRINRGGNMTIGAGSTVFDSTRLVVRGVSNVATSKILDLQSLSGTSRFFVSSDGEVTNSKLSGTGTRIMTASSTGQYGVIGSLSSLMREERFTATAAQTVFTISYTAPVVSGTNVPVRVYRNGVRLSYVASGPTITQFTYSGTTVTVFASTAGDIITVEYLN